MEQYLFGSARIRVLETGMIGRERVERLLEAGNTERCIRLLAEFGADPVYASDTGAFDREETLLRRLRTSFREVLSCAPDADFLNLWLYPYDCNNIKAAIKCARRGVDCRGMLFDFGTLDTEELIRMAAENNFGKLPPHFASAAAEASESFSKTANPQWVDLVLDRACYQAMLAAAESSGVDFAVRLVREKIDLVNLMICVRLLRMNSGAAGKGMLADALLPGGFLTEAYLHELYDAGEQRFWERLEYSDYRKLALSVKGAEASLTEIETAVDNTWMNTIREARIIPYGPETLIGYLLGSEYEVHNLRILLAGFGAQLPAHVVRERIRESYV